MNRHETLIIGSPAIPTERPPIARAAAAAPTRKPYSLEPDADVMAKARVAAAAARRSGRGGPREVTIDITGEINDALADEIEAQLRTAPNAEKLTMTIDSNGGSVAAAKRLHRLIRRHSAEVKRAVLLDKCHSAAVIVAIAADHRRALPHASILLHPTEAVPANRGRWTAARYASEASALAAMDDDLLDVLVARTGGARNALAAEDRTERRTPLLKALGLGLIHEIDGETAPLDPSMSVRSNGSLREGAVIGSLAWMASSAFDLACRSAPTEGER